MSNEFPMWWLVAMWAIGVVTGLGLAWALRLYQTLPMSSPHARKSSGKLGGN